MKITKIDVMQLGTDVRPDWRPIVCRIYTDEGIYGDGEAAMAKIPELPGLGNEFTPEALAAATVKVTVQ